LTTILEVDLPAYGDFTVSYGAETSKTC